MLPPPGQLRSNLVRLRKIGDGSGLRLKVSLLSVTAPARLPGYVAMCSIHPAACGDRPELLDAVGADADIPVVEVDGRVAMAGDQTDLVPERETVGGGRDGEPAVLVGGALVGGGGLVADERRARIEGQPLEAGGDDRAVLGRAAHHRRPDEEARLEGLGRGAVMVEVAAVIGVHEVRCAFPYLDPHPGGYVLFYAVKLRPPGRTQTGGSHETVTSSPRRRRRARAQRADPDRIRIRPIG